LEDSVEELLRNRIGTDGAIHLTLLDPERVGPEKSKMISIAAEKAGTTGIMIGGSTLTSTTLLDNVIQVIKKSTNLPVIIFPNNITSISSYADAIWFMSLLNSTNPYFIIGAQALGAPLIKQLDLEAIPLGYLIVGEGGAAGIIGQANPIPYDKPEIAAIYALAAQYFGMRFFYLEAGSGVKSPVPASMISLVKHTTKSMLLVGGGIRTKEDAFRAVMAGADIIVTGTIIEDDEKVEITMKSLIEGLRSAVNKRKTG
jgi:phosphoglycerol geranylgeranyltransferase